MTFDAAVLGADTIVLGAMQRRQAVTLLTERLTRLIQEPLVGAAVGPVAGDTSTIALCAEGTRRFMLKPIRTALVRMAAKAISARSVAEHRFVLPCEIVTADTRNVAVGEGVV